MTAFARARRFAASAPGQALADAVGLVALCGIVLAGFTVPALL